jgi:hypothetical protein
MNSTAALVGNFSLQLWKLLQAEELAMPVANCCLAGLSLKRLNDSALSKEVGGVGGRLLLASRTLLGAGCMQSTRPSWSARRIGRVPPWSSGQLCINGAQLAFTWCPGSV